MPSLFPESGQISDVGISAPNLKGDFVTAIDNPQFEDSFGVVVPWGGGATSRTYHDYSISNVGLSAEDLSLSEGGIFGGGGGSNITYNLEGLVGPQGPPGPMGPQGAQGLPGTAFMNSSFISDLSPSLDGITSVWGDGDSADTMVYASEIRYIWDITWQKLNIAAVKSWTESAMDDDGSFILIGMASGIYVSTDTGSTWAKKTPDSENFIAVSCSDTGGKAVALDDSNADSGKLWKSTDSGDNWSEVTITV